MALNSEVQVIAILDNSPPFHKIPGENTQEIMVKRNKVIHSQADLFTRPLGRELW
jgi:hypothetical protein